MKESNLPQGSNWIEREISINKKYQNLVKELLLNHGYIIQGEIEIQESDFDFQWEVCDIIYDKSKNIRIGLIGTGYIFDPDSKTIFKRDEF